MSIREMMSLAKSNLKASNGNEAPPPVAPPQGRPARSAKPVDAHSNDKASLPSREARGTKQAWPPGSPSGSGRSSTKKAKIEASNGKDALATFEGLVSWSIGPKRFWGFWGTGNAPENAKKFAFECEGSMFGACNGPLSGVYLGTLQEQGKPDIADQVTLSFEPLEGGASGWLLHGEGKCVYGVYTMEGTVSAGGVASVTRSGGIPNSETAAAMAAAAASSESRQERKRRREEAAAAAAAAEEAEEADGDAAEGGANEVPPAPPPTTSPGPGRPSRKGRELASSLAAAANQRPDPLAGLSAVFTWAEDARRACLEGEGGASSSGGGGPPWQVQGHHWLGARVRASLDAQSSDNDANLADGFLVGWRPPNKASKPTLWLAALPTGAAAAATGASPPGSKAQAGSGLNKSSNGKPPGPFMLRCLGEDECWEALKKGKMRRAAVVSKTDRAAMAREAAEVAAMEAAAKKGLELVIRHAHKAVIELESEREAEEQRDVSVQASAVRKLLASGPLKRDRHAVALYLRPALDNLVKRGKLVKASSSSDVADSSGLDEEASEKLLRFRSQESIAAEQLAAQQEELLNARYRRRAFHWPSWQFAPPSLANLDAGVQSPGDANAPSLGAESSAGNRGDNSHGANNSTAAPTKMWVHGAAGEGQPYTVGQRVAALFENNPHREYFEGTITAVSSAAASGGSGNGANGQAVTYSIAYDDGDSENGVPGHLIKPMVWSLPPTSSAASNTDSSAAAATPADEGAAAHSNLGAVGSSTNGATNGSNDAANATPSPSDQVSAGTTAPVDAATLRPPRPPRSAQYFFGLEHRPEAALATLGAPLAHKPRQGWHREVRLRKVPPGHTAKVDIYYYAPDGAQLRSRNEVQRYLESHDPSRFADAAALVAAEKKKTAAAGDAPAEAANGGVISVAARSVSLICDYYPLAKAPDSVVSSSPSGGVAMETDPAPPTSDDNNAPTTSHGASSSAAAAAAAVAALPDLAGLKADVDFDFLRDPTLVAAARKGGGSRYDNAAVSKAVGEAYEALSAPEKARFEAQAAADAKRWEQEDAAYALLVGEDESSEDDDDQGATGGSAIGSNSSLALPEGARRRQRVNYTETSLRLSDVAVMALQHLESIALGPASSSSGANAGAAVAAGGSGSAAAAAAAAPPGSGSEASGGSEVRRLRGWSGSTLCETVREMQRLQPERMAAQGITEVSARQVLGSAFRQGRLRRRVASLTGDALAARDLPGRHWLRTEAALRALVLEALQVSQNGLTIYDIAPDEDGAYVPPAAGTPEGGVPAAASASSSASSSSFSSSSSSSTPSSSSSSSGVAARLAAKPELYRVRLPLDPRVGCRAWILWPEDRQFYPCRCVSVEAGGGAQAACLLEYEDGGMKEWVTPRHGGVFARDGRPPGVAVADAAIAEAAAIEAAGYPPSSIGEAIVFEPKPLRWVSLADAMLTDLRRRKGAAYFLKPVDCNVFANYRHFVSQPSDLSTCTAKLHGGHYRHLNDFAQDVRLVWRNAMIYNDKQADAYKQAHYLAVKFEAQLAEIAKILAAENDTAAASLLPPSSKRAKVSAVSARPETGGATAASSAEGGDSVGAGSGGGGEDPIVEIEVPMTVIEIKAELQRRLALKTDARKFEVPIGWQLEEAGGAYTPAEPDPTAPRVGRDRELLEKLLEDDCTAAELATTSAAAVARGSSGPWLGAVVQGEWQVRDEFVAPALGYVLQGLHRSGHVEPVATEGPGGRARTAWIAANRYLPGEAPEKEKPKREGAPRGRKKKASAWDTEEDESEMSEFERQRRANMLRNQAFLAELGLG